MNKNHSSPNSHNRMRASLISLGSAYGVNASNSKDKLH